MPLYSYRSSPIHSPKQKHSYCKQYVLERIYIAWSDTALSTMWRYNNQVDRPVLKFRFYKESGFIHYVLLWQIDKGAHLLRYWCGVIRERLYWYVCISAPSGSLEGYHPSIMTKRNIAGQVPRSYFYNKIWWDFPRLWDKCKIIYVTSNIERDRFYNQHERKVASFTLFQRDCFKT